MAYPLIFHYQDAKTILHRTNPVFKILSLMFFSAAVVTSEGRGLILAAAFFIMFSLCIRFPLLRVIRELKVFLVFFTITLLLRMFFNEPDAAVFGVAISIEGVKSAGVYTSQLFLVLIASIMFTWSTSPLIIHNAVYKLLRPLRFLRPGHVSAMISLMLSSLPRLLDQFSEIRDAAKARCLYKRKNPFLILKNILLPLLTSVILSSRETAWAMEARCFCQERTFPPLRTGVTDIMFSLTTLAVSLGIFFIRYVPNDLVLALRWP